MNTSILSLLVIFLPMVSFSASDFYNYDIQSGKCLNSKNIEGLNIPDLEDIFSFDPGKDLSSEEGLSLV